MITGKMVHAHDGLAIGFGMLFALPIMAVTMVAYLLAFTFMHIGLGIKKLYNKTINYIKSKQSTPTLQTV
jgi:hypothetical protein